jgi:hypothetical protein
LTDKLPLVEKWEKGAQPWLSGGRVVLTAMTGRGISNTVRLRVNRSVAA